MATSGEPEHAAALGRALAALRRRVVRTCALPGCDRQFEGTTRRQYCSHQHAALAYWRRRQAERRTASSDSTP